MSSNNSASTSPPSAASRSTATAPPPAKNVRSLSGLAPFLRSYRGQIALAVLFLVMAAVSTLAFPVALKSLIDQGIVAADPGDRVLPLRGHFFALFGVGAALGAHSNASHAIAGGMPIEIAQQNLGHASLATTTVYVTTEQKRRMKAVESFWKR